MQVLLVEGMPIVAGMWGSHVRRKGLSRATAFGDDICRSFGKNYLSEEVLCSDMLIGEALR